MNTRRISGVNLVALLGEVLRSEDFDLESALLAWSRFPGRRLVNPLISHLCSGEEMVKWRAVKALGAVVSHMADEEMEQARTVMRRLIWSLNDESGGIGWGAPEAMGEIMADHERLATEFAPILVSYISHDTEDGNPLEHAILERGVLWGIGRLAQVHPHLISNAPRHLSRYLESPDPQHRGLSAWALGYFDAAPFRKKLEPLLSDGSQIRLFHHAQIHLWRIRDLAARAIGSEK